MGARDLNSGPNICIASTLPTYPALKFLFIAMFVWHGKGYIKGIVPPSLPPSAESCWVAQAWTSPLPPDCLGYRCGPPPAWLAQVVSSNHSPCLLGTCSHMACSITQGLLSGLFVPFSGSISILWLTALDRMRLLLGQVWNFWPWAPIQWLSF